MCVLDSRSDSLPRHMSKLGNRIFGTTPRSRSRRDAACRDLPQVQSLFLAAFCHSARNCGTAPLRGVVHFKSSRLWGRTRNSILGLRFYELKNFSFVPDEEESNDDDISPHKAVPPDIATVPVLTVIALRSKADRFMAEWRYAPKVCFRP